MSESEPESKRFLIERIAARAIQEGMPLTEREMAMLYYSAYEPGAFPADVDGSEDELEERLAGLLARSYRDHTGAEDRRRYQEAVGALAKGDHYVGWLGDLAGIHARKPACLRPFWHVGLVLLLVMPALVGLLMGAAGFWVAASRSYPMGERLGMSVVGLVFTGFAVFLLALWLRERRD